MIDRLHVGKYYEAIGAGKWADFKQDIKVVAVTTFQEAEKLEWDVYKPWFEDYQIDESMYQRLLLENGFVYHCKALDSRDPQVMIDGKGGDIYLFPMMVNYNETTELITCMTYKFEIFSRPYTQDDRFNPMTRLNIDLTSVINNAILPHIYDAVTVLSNSSDIVISKREYDLFTKEREEAELNIKTALSNAQDEVNRQLIEAYALVGKNEEDKEKIRLLLISAEQKAADAFRLFNTYTSRDNQLTRKQNVLEQKRINLVSLKNEFNERCRAADLEDLQLPDDWIPDFFDL